MLAERHSFSISSFLISHFLFPRSWFYHHPGSPPRSSWGGGAAGHETNNVPLSRKMPLILLPQGIKGDLPTVRHSFFASSAYKSSAASNRTSALHSQASPAREQSNPPSLPATPPHRMLHQSTAREKHRKLAYQAKTQLVVTLWCSTSSQ